MTESVHEGGRRTAREIAGDDRNRRAAASRQKPIALRRSCPLDADTGPPRASSALAPRSRSAIDGRDRKRKRSSEPAAVDDQRVREVEPAVLEEHLRASPARRRSRAESCRARASAPRPPREHASATRLRSASRARNSTAASSSRADTNGTSRPMYAWACASGCCPARRYRSSCTTSAPKSTRTPARARQAALPIAGDLARQPVSGAHRTGSQGTCRAASRRAPGRRRRCGG